MSTVTTYNGANPYGAMSKMAQVNIDLTTQDTLNIAVLDKTDKYTIRFWCKSSVNTTVTVMCGLNQVRTYTLDGDWTECQATFNGSVGDQVNFTFNARGQFLIWHPKLEIGTVATDFSDSTISLRSAILQTAEQIEAKVSKEGGTKQSFSWKLDAEGFYLYSNNKLVMQCDSTGLQVNGTGTFSGTVNASDGVFNGTVNASDGVISGDMYVKEKLIFTDPDDIQDDVNYVQRDNTGGRIGVSMKDETGDMVKVSSQCIELDHKLIELNGRVQFTDYSNLSPASFYVGRQVTNGTVYFQLVD